MNVGGNLSVSKDISAQQSIFVNNDLSVNNNAYIGNDVSINRFICWWSYWYMW